MRYFKVFDDIAPEGQLYRVDDSGQLQVECDGQPGEWGDSMYNAFFGEAALQQLVLSVQTMGGRIEDVEVGV